MRPIVLFLLLLTAGTVSAQTTAFPPDLADVQPVPPRRLVVKSEPAPVVKGAAGKKNKPAAGFTLRLMDADTGEVLASAAESLELPIPALPAKSRKIEGRIADVKADATVLALGADDGVRRGDRFEILKVIGEIKDPVTKTVLDLDTVKVGEFVADEVRSRIVLGLYGGQPIWADYAMVGRGYIARLLTK